MLEWVGVRVGKTKDVELVCVCVGVGGGCVSAL